MNFVGHDGTLRCFLKNSSKLCNWRISWGTMKMPSVGKSGRRCWLIYCCVLLRGRISGSIRSVAYLLSSVESCGISLTWQALLPVATRWDGAVEFGSEVRLKPHIKCILTSHNIPAQICISTKTVFSKASPVTLKLCQNWEILNFYGIIVNIFRKNLTFLNH